MMNGEGHISPKDLLGRLYESIYKPMSDAEAQTLIRSFSKTAEKEALPHKKAVDSESAENAYARAERFNNLVTSQTITRDMWNEFSPWLTHAISNAEETAHKATQQKEKNDAVQRIANLRRLQDYLMKKLEKVA